MAASLQARHQRECALYPWSTFANATKAKGCTCQGGPLYHKTYRLEGKLVREPVGRDRKRAQRELDALRGDQARGIVPLVQNITFNAWADEWLKSFTGKESSRSGYQVTIAYGRRAFGTRKVRDLRPSDVRRMRELVAERNANRTPKGKPAREVSPATQAKHLRQLGAILEAARREGFSTENAVRKLHKTARPKVPKSKPSYYTNAELPRLLAALSGRPVHAALCRAALLTGCRFGELAALTWSDLNLLERELHVRRTYSDGYGIGTPKSGDARVVDLTPQAAAFFEAWLVESTGEGLVFPDELGEHVHNWTVLKSLRTAMQAAGVPLAGEAGRKRDFHSFRHTFARLALEHGAEITWVQKQLGHSSIVLTVDVYGHWAREAEKAQAARLEGAFPV
jgi:integrase